jgi:hypothetical protein
MAFAGGEPMPLTLPISFHGGKSGVNALQSGCLENFLRRGRCHWFDRTVVVLAYRPRFRAPPRDIRRSQKDASVSAQRTRTLNSLSQQGNAQYQLHFLTCLTTYRYAVVWPHELAFPDY